MWTGLQQQQGFAVTHIAAEKIPQGIILHGVPLMLFASPENKILYIGRYGDSENQNSQILQQIRSGEAPQLSVLGASHPKQRRRR